MREIEELKDITSYEKEGLTIYSGYNEYCNMEIHIYKNGKHLFEWHNNANVDYPEDLSWDRMIAEVFWQAFNIGKEKTK